MIELSNFFVRIVILNYNQSNYTIELIEQLKKQTYKNYDILVIDNCSSYKQLQILQNELDKNIKTVYSEENLGYAAGNNLGLRYEDNVKVDFFLVLNNDLIIEDTLLIKKLVESILKNKASRVVAVSPIIDTISSGIDLSKQIQVRKILSKWETFMINLPIFKFYTNYGLAQKFLYVDEMPFIGKELFCDSINGAAFMIDAKFIQQNNYLDEGTFLYYEEIILGRQILDAGFTCLLNGTTSIKHLQGVSTKSSSTNINPKMERLKHKSALYYLKKYDNLNSFASFAYLLLSEVSILLKIFLSKFK